jgi:hypothetical protein
VAVFLIFHVQAQTATGTVAVTGILGYSQKQESGDRTPDTVPFRNHQNKTHDHTLGPSIGYFIKSNIELGAAAYLNKGKTEKHDHNGYHHSNQTQLIENKSYFLAEYAQRDFRLYVKYYKFLNEKVAVHGTISAGLSNMNSNTNSSGTFTNGTTNIYSTSQHEEQLNTFTSALSPGVTFFVSNKIGMTANFGSLVYSHHKKDFTLINTDQNESLQEQPHFFRQENSFKESDLELNFTSLHLNFGLSYFINR